MLCCSKGTDCSSLVCYPTIPGLLWQLQAASPSIAKRPPVFLLSSFRTLLLSLVKLLLNSLGLRFVVPWWRLVGPGLHGMALIRGLGNGRCLQRLWLCGCRVSPQSIASICRRVRRQLVVMNSDARPCLPSNISGVAQSLVYLTVLAVECIDAALVEDKGDLDARNIGWDSSSRPGFCLCLPSPCPKAHPAACLGLWIICV